jgi:uncharacterized membrane protein YqaE (UPF0057 family)
MGCGKIVLAIIFPPLAVLDRGITAILVTTLLTILGWIPGVIAAIMYNSKPQTVTIYHQQAPPPYYPPQPQPPYDQQQRQG